MTLNSMNFPAVLLDLILAITFLEWMVLAVRRRLTGRGLDFTNLSLGLVPGLFLMLALRVAAPADVPAGVFACCVVAGLFHICDFFRRCRAADAAAVLASQKA
jgi:hypothetical protein